jgi:hypothetical protein
MWERLLGVSLGKREKVIAIVREQDASLMTSVVELLPVCLPELPGFAGRQHIITPPDVSRLCKCGETKEQDFSDSLVSHPSLSDAQSLKRFGQIIEEELPRAR